jgi:hypothetical protein
MAPDAASSIVAPALLARRGKDAADRVAAELGIDRSHGKQSLKGTLHGVDGTTDWSSDSKARFSK